MKLFSFQGRLGRVRSVVWTILAGLICTAIVFLMTIFLADRAADVVLKVSALAADGKYMAENDIFALRQSVGSLWQSVDLAALLQNIGLLWQKINLVFTSWRGIDLISALRLDIDSVFMLLRNLIVLSIALTITLAIFIFSVAVRRLHDMNLSGWWATALVLLGIMSLIMAFVLPFVFIPVLLFVAVLKFLFWLTLLLWSGSAGENNYGLPDPPNVRLLDIVPALVLVAVILAGVQLGNNLQGKIATFQEVSL